MAKIDLVETDENSVPTKQEEGQPLPEEKETPSETPTEEKPADKVEGDQPKPEEEPEEETPEETPEVSDDAEDREIKGLQTQRDKLKLEVKNNIVNLRAQRREMRKETPEPVKDVEIDPEADEQLDSWAKKKGLVPKEQIISELNRDNLLKGMKDTDNEFYDNNPEYIYSVELRQAHDNIMDSLKEAPTAEEYKKQLELAHNIVKQNNPTLFPSSSDSTLSAKKQALNLAGKGKGGQAGSSPTESALTSEQKNEFRRAGYTEEEIKRMDKIKQSKNE